MQYTRRSLLTIRAVSLVPFTAWVACLASASTSAVNLWDTLEPKPAKAGDDTVAVVVGVVLDVVLFTEQTVHWSDGSYAIAAAVQTEQYSALEPKMSA